MKTKKEKKIEKVIRITASADFWQRVDKWKEAHEFPSDAETVRAALRWAMIDH